MMRTNSQNEKYHATVADIHKLGYVEVWNGEYITHGYRNPIQITTGMFRVEHFRDILKQLDLEYPKDDRDVGISSAKLTKEQMAHHINFLEVLFYENEKV